MITLSGFYCFTFNEDDNEKDNEEDGKDVEAGLPHPEESSHSFALPLFANKRKGNKLGRLLKNKTIFLICKTSTLKSVN